MKTKKILFILLAFFAISSVIISCKKDDDDAATPITPTGATVKTSVTGRITDTNGNAMSGVTIKLGSITTVSDNRGIFLFVNKDVPKTRMIVTATKAGFFDCVKAKKTQQGAVNYIDLVMEAYPTAVSINGTAGGMVNIMGGAKIIFPVNAFVDNNGIAYTGQVKIYARHINPGDANFEANVPGGDLTGVTASGQTHILYSLGMIEAKLYDNTGLNEIKLATGKTAELQFPIDPSQTADALSTIPMWHMNESTGIWQEEGQATKTGNMYIGTVSHFSIWNCDYGGARTDIIGKVVDCQNSPMAGVTVTINGFMNVITDNTGTFTTWVPVGYVIDCQVLQSNNPFLIANSPVQSITAVAGQVNIVPTLVVPCATRIMGTIKNCTGTAVSPGFVYATWNGGSTIRFSENGQYTVYVLPNSSINIMANYSGYGGSTTELSGAQGTLTTASDIQLCNAVVTNQNAFRINTNGQGSTLFVMSNITSYTNYTDANFDGIFETASIYIQGLANPGSYNCSISMSLNNDVADYYPLGSGSGNSITVSMDSIGMWTFESGYPAIATDNKLIFTDYGMPGGVTSGVYNFDHATGSITEGNFSVIRTE